MFNLNKYSQLVLPSYQDNVQDIYHHLKQD